MDKAEIIALRPRKLTFRRISDILTRTGEDIYSPEFVARIGKAGVGNALNTSYTLMAPELQAASISRAEYCDAFEENSALLKPVVDACGACLTNFFRSQAAQETAAPKADVPNGGLGDTRTSSPPSQEFKI